MENKSKNKKKMSGPAIFMNTVIWVCIAIFSVCFYLYYIKKSGNSAVLWTGIVTFMIVYHFLLRLVFGNISKHINIDYKWSFFSEQKFEKKLYSFLKVKKWKGKALTYNPEQFSLKTNSLKGICTVMAKSELDHWINEIISVVSIFFSLIWGQFPIFLLTAIAAMIFDMQFIIIQRYNRPRVLKILTKLAV